MFDVGEFVVFGSDGVCRVESVGSLEMEGISKEKLFYTLVPVGKSGNGKIFAPVDGKKVTIRRIVNKEEADRLIEDAKAEAEKQRRLQMVAKEIEAWRKSSSL